MSKSVGVMNGNFRNGDYLQQHDFTSPRDDVLNALKAKMDSTDYSRFFDAVYTRYRWTDEARYERILRYMLDRIKRAERSRIDKRDRVYQPRIHTSELRRGKSLNDMTDAERKAWWKSVEEVEVP